MLDTDYITVTLDDGRKFEAKLVGADPRLEVAVLKIDAADLPHFDLAAAVPADAGSARAGVQQPVRRGHRRRAGQRAARHDRRQDAARRPPRRVRDALSRPGLRARRHDQQPRRRRRCADQSARRAAGHARQGAAQRAEQHLAELRDSRSTSCAASVDAILAGKFRPASETARS